MRQTWEIFARDGVGGDLPSSFGGRMRKTVAALAAVALGSVGCRSAESTKCHADDGACAAPGDSTQPGEQGSLRLRTEPESAAPAWSDLLHERACSEDGAAQPARQEGRLVDVSAYAGVEGPEGDACSDTLQGCLAASMTGGVAAGDFDADGFPDLYVARLRARDSLYLNCRNGRFADVTEELGLSKADGPSNGAAWADVDGDADLDLFVTTFGPGATRHYLYLQEDGQFHEDGVNRGVSQWNTGPLYGTSVAFGDYDGDGYLDLYTGEWRRDDSLPEGAPTGNHARLFRNLGSEKPGFFEDTTERAGVAVGGDAANGIIQLAGAFVFTPIFSDLDDDGALDLALAADFGSSRLFWNRGDGTFADGTTAAAVGTEQAGMGASVADYDGDGRLDWFVTSIFEPRRRYNGNRLYRNLGKRRFVDTTDDLGVRDVGWGWGDALLDYDNDGRLDLLAVSGFTDTDIFLKEYDGRFALWRHPRGKGDACEDVAARIAPKANGQGRGVALLDFDNDGDQDVFVVYRGVHDALLRNDVANKQHFLRVHLRGKTNRFGVGGRVTLGKGEAQQLRELHAGSGYLSQSEGVAHFGRGADDDRVELTVQLPGGGTHKFSDVAVDRSLWISE